MQCQFLILNWTNNSFDIWEPKDYENCLILFIWYDSASNLSYLKMMSFSKLTFMGSRVFKDINKYKRKIQNIVILIVLGMPKEWI
jgi:hypothetical protein